MSGPAAPGVAANKKSFIASERKEQQRSAFRQEGAEWKVDDFVFVAAMGIPLDLARTYGRAAPGARVVETKPSTRGANLSVLGALGADGVRAAMSLPGAIDGDACLVFTPQVLVPCLHPGNIVFMDHGPTPKMAAITDAITAGGARGKFLPPYAPDFSPIAHCGSKIKTFLRGVAARTQPALDAALSKALATITRDDIEGLFTHCGYRAALK